MTRAIRLAAIIIASALACRVAPAAGRAPALAEDAPKASTSAASYNVYCDLASGASARARPAATIIFARKDADNFYFARVTAKSTSLHKVADGRVQDLRTQPGPMAPERLPATCTVVMKRRPGEIIVEAEGKIIARAYDDAFAGGEAGVGSDTAGIEVRDLYIQEVADIEFDDDFAAGEGAAAAWTPLEGNWRVALRRDPLVKRQGGPVAASWYEAGGPTRRLSVAGHDFWENYAAEASARADADTWLGIAFAVRDADNFCAFAVAPTSDGAGLARVLAVEGGRSRVIESASFSATPGQWYRVRVESFEHFARGLVNGREVLRATVPFCSGKLGLYSDGPGAAQFDDVQAESFRAFEDDFESAPLAAWQRVQGRWRGERGALVARSPKLNIVTSYAPWTDFRYAADVTVRRGAEAGLVFRHEPGSRYLFALAPADDGTTWRLAYEQGGRANELARGPIPGLRAARRRMEVVAAGGRLTCIIDGEVVARAYDFSLRAGRLGLFARGRGAAFDDVTARSRREPDPVVVSVADASGATLPWGRDGAMVPVLGTLWRTRHGSWSVQRDGGGEGSLVPRMAGGVADLWYRDECPGDAGLVATTAPLAGGGRLSLTICSRDASAASGYALSASDGRFSLHRDGRDVGLSAPIPAAERGVCRWELYRDGPFVVADANGRRLAYRDDSPLPSGRAGITISGPPIAVSSVRLTNRSAIAYKFDKVAPDWVPSVGKWTTHSGMACIAWDYWLTGHGKPDAFIWNRHELPPDQVVTVYVSEHSEGEETGEHRHFPYHDVNLAICGDGSDPDSGYRFVIGADGGRFTRLYRWGKLVLESQDPRFRITMGGHCNSPRAIGVVARKVGGHLQLILQGQLALELQDPEPLAGGRVGLGVRDCSVNFRDFVAYSETAAREQPAIVTAE